MATNNDSSIKPIKIAGELFYAKDMCEFNQYTEDSQKYVVQLGKLSAAAVEKLEDIGITVGTHEDKGRFVTCKSKFVIKATDEDDNEIDPRTIANGSKAMVVLSPYQWKFGKKSGTGASPKRVVVTEYIKYTPTASIDSEDDDYVL
jgi:hypothetical protein